MRRFRCFLARLAVASASLLLGAWLAAVGVFSADPHLHGFFHQHTGTDDNSCIACALAHGQCAAADSGTVGEAPPQLVLTVSPLKAPRAAAGADHTNPPERAPPVCLPVS